MNSPAFCVGLTGGIGSGKSSVADRFARLGAKIIDTDAIAHELTGPGGAAMAAIVASFGSEIQDLDGALDRAEMRRRAFADPVVRKQLEALLHPLIRAVCAQRLEAVAGPYAMLVVPLLVENWPAYRPMLDRVVVVDCDEAQQLSRTAARAGLSLDQARAILAAQASRAARLEIADDLIDNRGDMVNLDHQVECLHLKYLNLAEELSRQV